MNKTKKSWITLAVIFAATVFFACMIPHILMDNELRHFFPENHESYQRYNALTDTFGDQYTMDIVIETKEDTILYKDALDKIAKISEAAGNLNYVTKVESLTTIDFITDNEGELVTGSLIPDDFTGSRQEFETLRNRILEWPSAYISTLISSDFKGVQIVVTISDEVTPPELSTLYADTVKLVKDTVQGDRSLTYRIAGDPVLSEYAKIYMYDDLKHLIPLIILVVLLCLFFSFKNMEGTLLPLIAVLISTVWTIGIMAIVGEPLTIVSSCIPVLLIAVGSAYGIHIVNYYYQGLGREGLITSQERHQELVTQTLKNAKSPVFLAGITTIAGFVSTITSPIKPLKAFAIYSAIGIVIALAMAFTFIPSVLMLKPLKRVQKQQHKMSLRAIKNNARRAALGIGKNGSGPDKVYSHLNQQRTGFIVGLLVIIGLSIWGVYNLNIESAFLEYFPKDSVVRKDVQAIDEKYVGSTGFSFVISGQEKGDICKPEILKQMDDMQHYLEANHPDIGKILSFTDFIKRMNQVMSVDHTDTVASSQSSGESVGSFFDNENSGETGGSFFDDEDTGESSGSFFDTEDSDESALSFFDDEPAAAAVVSEPLNRAVHLDNMSSEDLINLFVSAYARGYSHSASGELTVPEFLDSLKRELNYRGAAYYEIPYDIEKYPVSTREELKNIVSQYLVLYSGSLDSLLDANLEPTKTRMRVTMRTHDTGKMKAVIEDAEYFAKAHFPEGYTLEAAGLGELEVAMTSMIISSQISSLLLAIAIVFGILSVFYRSPVAGLVGAIPLCVSILLNFGIMTLTGINLDMVTSLVASIAIGIGIDYTVHFMNDYHNERLLSSDLTQVTIQTLKNSGKGIAINAFSVGFGFLVLCFSQFVVLRFVGFLVAEVMLTSSVAALTILPVVLNIFKPKFMAQSHEKLLAKKPEGEKNE